MKQDYLWDKTGSDPDIERLEELLSDFRYTEKARSGSNVVEFPSKEKRSMQPWIFAMAACIAVGAVAISLWNLSSIHNEAIPMQIALAPQEIVIPAPHISIEKTLTAEPETATPQLAAAPKKHRNQAKQKNKAVVRKPYERRETPVLTEEEKYAYGQLLLALSITNSKWKVVQDSINGVEEGNTNDR